MKAIDYAKLVRKAYDENDSSLRHTAEFICKDLKTKIKTHSKNNYCTIIGSLLNNFLRNNQYEAAAHLLWGGYKFDPTSVLVQETWDSVKKQSKLIIIGGGSLGKSYNLAIWFLLDWLKDPDYTEVRIISTTGEHAKQNVFGQIKEMHSMAMIPLPGDPKGESISIEGRMGGLFLFKVPQGDSGYGRLRGFHPKPRLKPHPIFGYLSRLRLLLDEAEQTPIGVWEGVDNMLSSDSDEYFKNGTIKIAAATNPKDKTSQLGIRCEPLDGWMSFRLNSSHRWKSTAGWAIQRLDAARCENVIQRKVVVPGMQTYEGYMNYLRRGEMDSEYWCVDEQTEVLSKRGWLKNTEVKEGDFIYTLNIKNGIAEWKPVNNIFNKHYDGELVSMESRHFSALVTANHKWAIEKNNKKSFKLIETKDILKNHLIPLIREGEHVNNSAYSENFASIMGWWITDGTYQESEKRISIAQSNKVNPDKCKIIEELLVESGVKFSSCVNMNQMKIFYIYGDLSEQLKKACPNKKLTIEFIESLGKKEKKSLLNSMILGDGGIQGGSTPWICVNNKQQAEVYSVLGIRCGYAVRIGSRVIESKFPNGSTYKKEMYYIDFLQTKTVKPQYFKIELVKYKGNVWCPSTENQTFYAKRNGKTYFTGNTMARGAFPSQGVIGVICPESFVQRNKGSWIFEGEVKRSLGIDLAMSIDGDDAPMFVFSSGIASKWIDPQGKVHDLEKPKYVIQADDWVDLKKYDDTQMMVDQIRTYAETLQVEPRRICVDKTGNGKGVNDILNTQFGPVQGVDYGWSATETKILEEDEKNCKEMYDNITTELFYAAAKYFEFGYIKINPKKDFSRFIKEMTTRRYIQKGKGITRAESKGEFKSRISSRSPDHADSFTLGIHAIRMAEDSFEPKMVENKKQHLENYPEPTWIDRFENVNFDD